MATIKDRYILEIDVNGAVGGLGNLQGALGRISGGSIINGVNAIGAAIAAIGVASIQAAKQFETYNNQLRLITTSQSQLTETMGKLNTMAVQNRAAFGDTVELFSKLTLATDGMGKSQADVMEVTTKFQQALALSGADANTAGAAIRQFSQAMASGTVRGDEFVTITEALGPALIIMARESGKTVGELRAMSQAGLLTNDVFFELIQNSNALGEAFNKTQKTIGNLEQEVADAAGKMLASMAEGSGLADLYRLILEDLARGMRDLAGAQTDVEAANIPTIFALARDGAISYADAITEIDKRLKEAVASTGRVAGANGFFYMAPGQAEEIDALNAALERAKSIQEQVAIETEKLQRIQRIANEDRARALAPIQDEMKAINQYTIAQAASTSELEKALRARQAVAEVILGLQAAVGTEAEKYVNLNEQIAIANAQHGALTDRINELTEATAGSNFGDYYESLVSGAAASAESADFAVQAQTRLIEQLNSGAISIDTYAFAMDALNLSMDSEPVETFATYMADLNQSITDAAVQTGFQSEAIAALNQQLASGEILLADYKIALDAIGGSFEEQMVKSNNLAGYMQDLQSKIDNTIATDQFKAQAVAELNRIYGETGNLERYTIGMEALGERVADTSGVIKDSADWMLRLEQNTADAQMEFDNLGMNDLDRQISTSANKIKNELAREIQALQEIQNTANYDVIQSQIDALTAAASTAIDSQSELARKSNEYQRSFAYGWNQAFQEYSDSATNAANIASGVFRTATGGMEDLLFNFVKTGKFSWKEYGQSIVDELLKANIKQVVAGFWGTQAGQGIAGLLGSLTGNPNAAQEMTAGKPDGTNSNPLYVVNRGMDTTMDQFANNIGTSTKSAMGGVTNTLGSMFGGFGNTLSSIFGGFGSTFSGLLSNLLGGFGGLFGGFGSTLSSMFGGLTSGLSGLFGGGGGGLLSGIASLFGGGGGGGGKGKGGGGGGLFSGIASTISSIAGGIGDLFGGFFATGGMIPPGRFGVVGERGPEYISGPANITPMAATQVTYNINAVDALSFRELIARDPEFIYAVSQRGGRNIPVRG